MRQVGGAARLPVLWVGPAATGEAAKPSRGGTPSEQSGRDGNPRRRDPAATPRCRTACGLRSSSSTASMAASVVPAPMVAKAEGPARCALRFQLPVRLGSAALARL